MVLTAASFTATYRMQMEHYKKIKETKSITTHQMFIMEAILEKALQEVKRDLV